MNDMPSQTAPGPCPLLPLVVLAVVIGTCAGVSGLSHWPRLEQRLMAADMDACAAADGLWKNAGYYADFEDRMLLEELPAAKHSSDGSTCFIGSSSMKWGTMLWTLPEEKRARFHNFAFGGTSHAEQFAFVRYLVEQEGLLGPAPTRTHIVIGVCYRSACITDKRSGGFFQSTLARHGFWNWTGEVELAPMNDATRWLRREEMRCRGFLDFTRKRLPHWLRGRPTRPWKSKIRKPDYWKNKLCTSVKRATGEPEDIVADADTPGENWKACIPQQVAELSRMIAYLDDHGVRVTVVRLPRPKWVAELPYPSAYADELHRQGIVFIDKSDAIADDSLFRDSSHTTFEGLEVLHNLLMEIAE